MGDQLTTKLKEISSLQNSEPSTRARIVEAARELFWSQGYEATSLADVISRARVKSGSLYYFFRTKEDLLVAVLDRYTELLWPIVIQPVFERVSDPVERIFGILEGYKQGLMATGYSGGCPIGNLAIEVSDAHPRVREKITANFNAWCGWIRKCLDDAGERFPPGLDRDALASFVLTVMEGGVMQSRAHRKLKPFEDAVRQLRDYFDRLLAEGARVRQNQAPETSI